MTRLAEGRWFPRSHSTKKHRGLRWNRSSLTLEPLEERRLLSTVLLRDVNAVNTLADPQYVTSIGSALYFSAYDGTDRELWRVQGSAATKIDINDGPSSSEPRFLADLGGTLYFSAFDGTDRELWSFDGAIATKIDVAPGSASSNPTVMANIGSAVYFSAEEAGTRELFKYDGVAASRIDAAVGDITDPLELTVVGTTLYFTARLDGGDVELFSYTGSGTAAKIEPVAGDIRGATELTSFAGGLCFVASDGAEWGLWEYDGAVASQITLPGATTDPADLTVVGGTLYLTALGEIIDPEFGTPTRDLLMYAGGAAANQIALPPGTLSPANLEDVSGTLYFTAMNGAELWSYNGSTFNEVQLGPGVVDPSQVTEVGTLLYYSAFDGTDRELWKYNGTSAVQIDIQPGPASSDPTDLVEIGGVLYLVATDPAGRGVVRYDGTAHQRIAASTTGSSYPTQMTAVGNVAYFAAFDGTDNELWRHDGSTTLKIDVNPGPGSSSISSMEAVGSLLYFSAFDGTDWELNSYNGSSIAKINVNPSGYSVPSSLTNVGGALYFRAYVGGTFGLWKYDGSSLSQITLPPDTTNPTNLVNSGGTLYFTAVTGSTRKLFKYTGGASAEEIALPGIWSNPAGLTDVGGTLYFTATSGATGGLLVYSGGASASLVSLPAGVANPSDLAGAGANLYFSAQDPVAGRELFKYDGSTFTLVDVLAGPGSSAPTNLAGVGSILYFSAWDGTERELFEYISGPAANRYDLNPQGSSFPAGMADVGGTLYLSAYHRDVGVEPWKVTRAGGVVVTPIANRITTEAGGIDTFTIVLTQQPTADVVIPLSSSNPAEGRLEPSGLTSVTFTVNDWATPKTVTIKGVDDDIDDGNIAYTIVTGAAVSADSAFNGVDPDDVSAMNIDDDTAGVVVSPLSGHTTEGGGTATFSVRLSSQPVANVEVHFASSDPTEGIALTDRLTFTPFDWDQPQTVTVTGADDALLDGDITYTIISTEAMSSDPKYRDQIVDDVLAVNEDNEDDWPPPGATLSPVSGNTTEGGATATFTIVLDCPPAANVEIQLTSSDLTEGIVSPSRVIFTPTNWATPQVVTVTGVDDSLVDGPMSYTIITSEILTSDPRYRDLSVVDVTLINQDNETGPGVAVTPMSLTTTEGGGTATFTVCLNSKPTSNVELRASSSDLSEGILAANPTRLIFTPTNYSTPQTVTVYGRNDALDDGDITYSIVFAPALTSDLRYRGMVVTGPTVVNIDDELPLLAEGTPESGDAGQRLTARALRPIVAEAYSRWNATGLTAQQRSLLRRAHFVIGDLEGATLGLKVSSRTVLLDDDAAGFGWFVDRTPRSDEEFDVSLEPTEEDSRAFGKMDLLTVVMHEMGHLLGFGDVEAEVASGSLMADTLAVGLRRVPDAGEAAARDAVFAGFTSSHSPAKVLPTILPREANLWQLPR